MMTIPLQWEGNYSIMCAVETKVSCVGAPITYAGYGEGLTPRSCRANPVAPGLTINFVNVTPSEANFWWLYYIVAHGSVYFNIFCGSICRSRGAGPPDSPAGVVREALCASDSQYHPHFLFFSKKKTAVEPSKEKTLIGCKLGTYKRFLVLLIPCTVSSLLPPRLAACPGG